MAAVYLRRVENCNACAYRCAKTSYQQRVGSILLEVAGNDQDGIAYASLCQTGWAAGGTEITCELP